MNRIESGDLILPRAKLSQNNNNNIVYVNHAIDVEELEEKREMKHPKELIQIARKTFNTGITKDLNYREKQLKGLLRFIEERIEDIENAIYKDLRKHKQEVHMGETELVANDLRHTIYSFKKWAKPQKQEKRLVNLLDEVFIYNDPYGVVLIIGAWNYPILLTLGPLVGALAAGNCVILKPSELSPATADLLFRVLPKYVDPEILQISLGGIPETTALLEERFDYIFFTGSSTVGKIVYKAAAEFLTPVTLELGGKSPVYVDETMNMEQTAKRILWGKLLNSGQTCVAPDYMICTKEVQDQFIEAAKEVLKEFYGKDLLATPDISKIVTPRHFDRLINFLRPENIAVGGYYDRETLLISPTILKNVHINDPIMQEEIFGPILPILVVKDLDEAISVINAKEKPLAMYIFTKKKGVREEILKRTSAGGVTVNDTVVHLITENIPFGGVGGSGIGAYHGKTGFDTWSHQKGVLIKDLSAFTELSLALRQPPYCNKKTALMNFVLKRRRGIHLCNMSSFLAFVFGVIITCLVQYLWQYTDEF